VKMNKWKVTKAPKVRETERELGLGVKVGDNLIATTTYKVVSMYYGGTRQQCDESCTESEVCACV